VIKKLLFIPAALALLAAVMAAPLAGCALVDQLCRDLAITNKTFPDGTVGALYTGQMTVDSNCDWWRLEGNNLIEYSVKSGSVPPGVELDAKGAFYGVPSAAGVFAFDASARHAVRNMEVSKSFTISIH